jgi:hypothetical protein
LYGLDDASRKFWLKVKEILKKAGFKLVIGDEALYYFFKDGKLVSIILTHVDDFFMAGTRQFLDWIGGILRKELQISKVERNKFRFTSIDIEKTSEGIKISMNDYANSLQDVTDIRLA